MAGAVCAVVSPSSDWVRLSCVVLPSSCTILPLSRCSSLLLLCVLPCVLGNCVLFCSALFPVFVFVVTVLLVWGCVFVTGLCHCGMAVGVYVGVEERWYLLSVVNLSCVVGCGMAVCEGVWFLLLSCLLFFFLLVFGVVRAQLCEHARNTPPALCILGLFI